MAQRVKNSIEKKDVESEKSSFVKRAFDWVREKKIRWISLGVILLIAVFLLFQIIGRNTAQDGEYQTVELSRGNLIAIVGATGIVKPKQSAELNWGSSGKVEYVKVDVGDIVEDGDILAEIAKNTLPQSVIIASADLVTTQKALEDLLASDTDTAAAYRALLDAERDLDDAEEDRDHWNYNNANLKRLYEARTAFILAEEELRSALEAFDALADLDIEDPEKIAADETLDEFQHIRDKALRNLNYIMGKSYDKQVAEDFADYDLAFAEYQDVVRDWERLREGPNSDDIKAAESRVAAAEATVSLGWLDTPFSGTVTESSPKAGDLVSVGMRGFRIDDLSELFVDVDISEVDINRVKPGQRAELTFDAITGKIYAGEVTEVASVGSDKGSGVEFQVTVKLLDADENVRSGMTAAVNIIVNEIEDVQVVPNRAIRLIEGQRVVYVLKDGELEQVEIEVGASSDVDSEITSGDIEPGMKVVLNPPLLLHTNGGPPGFVR
jgi:HlyD family secretion protein